MHTVCDNPYGFVEIVSGSFPYRWKFLESLIEYRALFKMIPILQIKSMKKVCGKGKSSVFCLKDLSIPVS